MDGTLNRQGVEVQYCKMTGALPFIFSFCRRFQKQNFWNSCSKDRKSFFFGTVFERMKNSIFRISQVDYDLYNV